VLSEDHVTFLSAAFAGATVALTCLDSPTLIFNAVVFTITPVAATAFTVNVPSTTDVTS